mgnify:CR=1 FL=1
MNMTWFFDLLSTALYTVFIQNLVFNGGYAASEALMLAKKPRRLWMFSAMIAFFSTVTALACRALEMIPVLSTLPSALHFAMFSGVLIVVFLITGLILKLALGATEKFLGTLGMAALNTLVLATPLLNRSAAYTLRLRHRRGSRVHSRGDAHMQGAAHNLAESGYAQSLPRHSGGVRLRRAALARVLRLLGQLPVLIIN